MNQYDKRHLANVRKYQRKIDAIYKKAAEEAARRAASLPAPDDYIFTFDDFPAVKKQIDALMAQMAADMELTVTDGIRAEWDLANAKNDALVNTALGDAASLARYHRTNADALNAFLGRKQNGLGLSDRVWRYTNQFKNEIEMGLDLGIREGKDAASIARSIQQYLQHPDMLFRRVRDKHGVLQLSKRAAAFHPGQGVYRSSYKNARRLAATETNIAYRTSDHERWKDLDFIVGIEVHLSNNHTCLNNKGKPVAFFDICDELKGKYPKEFKFTGWHPHCRCIATPILKTKEELDADDERLKRGEEPIDPNESENAVTEMPDGWDKWMEDNAERLENAKSMPYFIRDNFKDGDPSQGLRWAVEKPLTPAEIRHMNRTPEQEQAIRDAWAERRAVRHYGENMMRVMGGISDIDTTALEKALIGGDIAKIEAEAQALKKIGKEITALDKLQDPLDVARKTSFKQAKEINTNVTRTLFKMPLDLEERKSKLEFEIRWMGDEGKKRYPSTYMFAQDAYKKALSYVEERIEINKLTKAVDDAMAYASISRSKPYRELAGEVKALLSAKDIDIEAIEAKSKLLNAKYAELQAKKTKRLVSKEAGNYTGETLEELKQRLGSRFPETLPHLDDAIAKYEKGARYGKSAKTHKAEVETVMRELFAKHDLGMNVPDSNLELILNSWFKNTFEVGKSGGYVGSTATTGKIDPSHGRLGAAHRMFGISGTSRQELIDSQLRRRAYEKYGNLLDHDILDSMAHNTAKGYGNIEVRFKKDKVVATWTAGDSLGCTYQPSLVTDPRSCSFDDIKSVPTIGTQTSNLAQFKRDYIRGYLELQYHGDLTIDCVESITFPYNPSTRPSMLSVAKKWKAKGVDIYYIDGGALHQL